MAGQQYCCELPDPVGVLRDHSSEILGALWSAPSAQPHHTVLISIDTDLGEVDRCFSASFAFTLVVMAESLTYVPAEEASALTVSAIEDIAQTVLSATQAERIIVFIRSPF
jgi:hypothetical protein